MNNIDTKKDYWVFPWILLACLMGTYLFRNLSDPDLWWHIVIGRWIVAHGELPTVDLWNAYAVGKPWLAYSWTFEIPIAWVDSHFGLSGLFFAQCLQSLALSFCLFFCFYVASGSGFISAMLGAIVLSACINNFSLRPQTFSWMLLGLQLLAAEMIRRKGLSPLRLVMLVFLSMLWANSNITAVIGVASVCAWVLPAELRRDDRLAWKVLGSVAMASFLGTLITPYLGMEWAVVAGKSFHPWSNSYIVEFQPSTIYIVSFGLVILLTVLLGFFIHYQPHVLPIGPFALGAGFVCLSFCVIKFIPQAAIVLGFLLAVVWYERKTKGHSLGHLGVALDLLESRIRPSDASSKVNALIVASIFFLGIVNNTTQAVRSPLIDENFVPESSLDFILANDLPLPVANIFGDGGYILYRFSDSSGIPKFRVPLDGRTNVNDYDILQKHLVAFDGDREWAEYFDAVGAKTVLWLNSSPLTTILIESPKWCLVYSPEKVDGKEIGSSVFVALDVFRARSGQLTSPDCSLE